jgi:hypothetical protein
MVQISPILLELNDVNLEVPVAVAVDWPATLTNATSPSIAITVAALT